MVHWWFGSLGSCTSTQRPYTHHLQAANKPGSRKQQTAIVNKSISSSGGIISIDAQNPYFDEVREKIENKYGGEKNKGHIRCVAEKICGGPEKLDEAVEQGQVTVSMDENNIAFYAIKTMVCGKITSTHNITRIGRAKAISTDDFAKMANNLAAMGWNFKATPKQVKQAEENKGYPIVCIEKMDSAKDASKKLLVSCSQIHQKLSVSTQNQLVAQAASSLIDMMGMLQNKEATLDSMRLLGRWPNKRVATIDEVIKCKKYLVRVKSGERADRSLSRPTEKEIERVSDRDGEREGEREREKERETETQLESESDKPP